MDLLTFAGYLTGLRFVAPEMDLETLLRTALVANICHAIVCGVVAANAGRHRTAWTAIGFVFGIWAVTVALLLPRRATRG